MGRLCCTTREQWVEDGPKAWTIVLGSFLTNLAVLGMVYSFGIFVIPISEEFGASRADVALVGTLSLACFFGSGIFAGALGDRYGVRPVMSAGWVLWVVGCLSASFCYEFGLLFLTEGVLVGVGAGLAYWPAISVVPQWFNVYRGTAVGVAALGSGIGSLIFALAGQTIISALGWRNTLRVFMGFGGGLMLIAIAVMERRFPPRPHPGGLFFVAKRLVKLTSYRWFLFATFFFQWGFFIPYIHLAAYISDIGLGKDVQGLALAMIGAGSSVGRIVMGPVADVTGRLPTFRLCMFATGVTLATWPACQSPESFYCFGFFYGFFGGGFITLSPVVAGDLWGVETLGGTFTLLNLMMIPGALAGGPVAGAIYNTYGTYWPAIWLGAGFILICALALFGVRKEAVVVQGGDANGDDDSGEVKAESSPEPQEAATTTIADLDDVERQSTAAATATKT